MGMFGENTPALWDSSKSQTAEATQIDKVSSTSNKITFLSAHDFELGMRLYLNGFTIVGGGFIVFTGWVYVIGITAFTVTIDQHIMGSDTTATVAAGKTVTGYIALDYATHEQPNFVVKDKIVHTSIINGHKNTIKKGNYSNFSLKLNLMKYGDLNRQNLVRLLLSYDGQELLFFPHWETGYIKDASSVGVEFNMDIVFKYIDSTDFRDVGFIELYSQEYTDISKNI